MATEKKLDCVILGLLSHEQLTGYEIKKRMDTTLKYFWGASYGSIYPTLNDLVKRDLATKVEDKTTNRKKITYSITDEGREYLRNWLKLSVEKDELRYETLLKLFFGNEVGPKQTLLHIKEFQFKIEGEMEYLLNSEKVLEKVLKMDSTHKYYLLTVKFGIQTYQAYLNWCKEAVMMLEKDGE